MLKLLPAFDGSADIFQVKRVSGEEKRWETLPWTVIKLDNTKFNVFVKVGSLRLSLKPQKTLGLLNSNLKKKMSRYNFLSNYENFITSFYSLCSQEMMILN